jgi:hypothetical protein
MKIWTAKGYRNLRIPITDGAVVTSRAASVRLGPESFTPAVPDSEIVEIARAAAVLGEERNDAFVNRVSNDAFGKSDGI